MSYDGYIVLRVQPEGYQPDGDAWELLPSQLEETCLAEVGNYTSNVSGMWARALEATAGDAAPRRARDEAVSLSATDGWTCERAAPVLIAAAGWMRGHRAELVDLNPENGWGNYDGALDYLERAAALCRQLATVRSDHGQSYLRWSY